jgi:UDP:flavonoid glycosyltransferase YjiC (YdhE family)
MQVRALFCFVNGPSHFEPLVPVASAVQGAGHIVAVACSPWRVPVVEAAGFEAFAIGASSPEPPARRLPLREVDMAREEQTVREVFADRAARRRATGVRALAADWRPDVIVADELDFGAVVAAEAFGVPHAVVLVLAAGSLVRADVVADTLDQVRREHGLPADPDLAEPSRYLVLNPFPPSLRDPEIGLPLTAHSFRSVDLAPSSGAVPSWTRSRHRDPNVYFTLGTQFNVESGDLFSRVIAGLAQLPANVLVTVGHQIDPAELGRQPAHVRVERYIPQSEILPYCDAVVFHGGSGTLIGASTYGLPMVLLAMGADQPANAARCRTLGVGLSLDPVRVSPAEIRDSVLAVLQDPVYRRAAQRLQAQIAAQPDVATTVDLLEQLASGRRPLHAD